MQKRHFVGYGLVCFVVGMAVQAGLAQDKRPTYSPGLFKNLSPNDAATTLLDGALQLAGNGSWERIAVARAWYLGGEKARGQTLLDEVTGSKRVEASDWFRVARVYEEAGEWDKAATAFDTALAMSPKDDTGMIEAGGLANLHQDRPRAEALFERAFQRNPRHFWHWVNAGGSYLGVRPQ